MSNAWTPGPWEYEATTITPDFVGSKVFRFSVDGVDLPTTEANACVAAAAPELFDALEEVAACMLNGGDGETGDYGWRISRLTKARPMIRAALAKARGEQA